MKKIYLLIIILLFGIGCAGTPKTLDPNYQAYQQAMLAQKPLVSIEWSEDGSRIKKLDVNPQVNIQQKAPDAPHPAWAMANSLIRVGGIVGGIWAGGQALEGVIEASRGNYANSFNTSSQYNSSTSNNSSVSSSETTYPSGESGSGGALPPGSTIEVNHNSGNTTTDNSNQGNNSNNPTDNSNQGNNSNNPIDNSNQGNPVNNSNQGNPIDNSNQNNPITNPPAVP